MHSDNNGRPVLRDPAQFAESSTDPDPIPDSIEDIIRETIFPEKLLPAAIGRLTKLIQTRQEEETISADAKARIKAIVDSLRPTRFELIDRWAFNYVYGDDGLQGLTHRQLAAMLGVREWCIHAAIKKWNRLLKYIPPGARSQANHLGHRTRRRNQAKRATSRPV